MYLKSKVIAGEFNGVIFWDGDSVTTFLTRQKGPCFFDFWAIKQSLKLMNLVVWIIQRISRRPQNPAQISKISAAIVIGRCPATAWARSSSLDSCTLTIIICHHGHIWMLSFVDFTRQNHRKKRSSTDVVNSWPCRSSSRFRPHLFGVEPGHDMRIIIEG